MVCNTLIKCKLMKKAPCPGMPVEAAELPGYMLLEETGRGSTGTVYKAIERHTGRLAAVKIPQLPATLNQADAAAVKLRFKREAWFGRRLAHPHISRMLDKGWLKDGRPWIVFEYLEGHTLKTLIQTERNLEPVLAGTIMGQVLEALTWAHRNQVIHCDLKPQNIMVCQEDTGPSVRLLDFGSGLLHYGRMPWKEDAFFAGTPSYAPPELIRGERPGPASDLYAWGLILLECITGHPVMRGRSVAAVHKRHLSRREIAIPSFLWNHPLRNLLKDVLRKDMFYRAADAGSLLRRYNTIDFGAIARSPLPADAGHFPDTDVQTTRISPPRS